VGTADVAFDDRYRRILRAAATRGGWTVGRQDVFLRRLRTPRKARTHGAGNARRRGRLVLRALRSLILAAADSPRVRRFVRRYGDRFGAKRFVAGETLDEFLTVAKAANTQGFAVAAGVLGEGVRTAQEADAAADRYCELLQIFHARGIDANVAFKLTHVGLDIDPELAFANASRIARTARDTGNTMRLDMEQSRYVDATLAIYRRLRAEYDCVGCVLQSYLYRSAGDLQSLLASGLNVRIVKGAYLEPPDAAYPKKSDVDAQYVRLAAQALERGQYTAIATHDTKIVDAMKRRAHELGLPKRGRFEFQLLYGIRTDVARELVREGYRVRLAIPFGQDWFPYLMRRLAERPANLAFVLRASLRRS
jgi:proline dehydrogenase